MDKQYDIYWSQVALDELMNIQAYPFEVKERIYLDTFNRFAYSPTLTARQITKGILKNYWVRLGLFQVMIIFEVNEDKSTVWIDGIKHKRENVYWK